MSSFQPRLDLLPPAQLALWPELASVSKSFVLYGGTALALRLGHRTSVDFDLFSSEAIDHRKLERLPLVRGAQVLQSGADTLTVSIGRDAPIKVSFFGPIGFGRVGEPELADSVIELASLLDLAGTKIKALVQRVEAKDYLDIAALLRAGVSLPSILAAARALFGDAFNPIIARKTLAWFEGGNLTSLDQATRDLLSRAALEDVELPAMSLVSERLSTL